MGGCLDVAQDFFFLFSTEGDNSDRRQRSFLHVKTQLPVATGVVEAETQALSSDEQVSFPTSVQRYLLSFNKIGPVVDF